MVSLNPTSPKARAPLMKQEAHDHGFALQAEDHDKKNLQDGCK